jgi:hypothetical protein
MAPLIAVIAALLSAVIGAAASDRTLRLRAVTLLGQVFVFRFGRETVVRAVGLSGYSAQETAEIRAVLLDQLRATLAGLGVEASDDDKGDRS